MYNHQKQNTMDKTMKEIYERRAQEVKDKIETCDYSDNYQLVCILAKMADLVHTLIQEVKATD